MAHLETRTGRPVRSDPHAELVLAPDLRVGDRLPESLGRGADIDLENLFHGTLQSGLEAAQRSGPRFCVLAHPSVMDEADGDRVQEVELFAAATFSDNETSLFELLEVLHDAKARHREALLERTQGLPVLTEQFVEKLPSGRIGESFEHFVHEDMICDLLVTCQ